MLYCGSFSYCHFLIVIRFSLQNPLKGMLFIMTTANTTTVHTDPDTTENRVISLLAAMKQKPKGELEVTIGKLEDPKIGVRRAALIFNDELLEDAVHWGCRVCRDRAVSNPETHPTQAHLVGRFLFHHNEFSQHVVRPDERKSGFSVREILVNYDGKRVPCPH